MPFSDFDDDFASTPPPGERSLKRAEVTPAQFAAMPNIQVPSGYFVLTLTDGARKRFRIRLERGKFLTGKRTVSIHRKLDAPAVPHSEQIEHEWESLATIEHDGCRVFKRWRNQWEETWALAMWKLLDGGIAPGYSVECEPRCHMTMRELTDDTARRTGLNKKWRKILLG